MLRYFIALVCVTAVSADKGTCAKTCQGQTCDYWNVKADFSCEDLEAEYGCDCKNCKCPSQHRPCSKYSISKCHGRTCDAWIEETGTSCERLEKNFKCKCTGCKCKTPPASKPAHTMPKKTTKKPTFVSKKSASTGVCPAAIWKTATDGLFTSDDLFVGDEGPSKFDTVYFKKSEDKPYSVTIPEKTDAEVGMIVLKPGAWLVVGEGSVLTSRATPDCTLSECSGNVQANDETGYDVMKDQAVSCKSTKKPDETTKKPSCPNDYDNDGLCGDDDKCPFSADNDGDNDGLCEFKCQKAPKGARLDLSRKTDRQDVTRASGQKRVEDTRLGNVFEKEFGGEMYICLRTDPCPNDKTNKCKEKPPQTPKPTMPKKSTKPMTTSKKTSCPNDYDNDGLCGDDDKCPFSADNDGDKDGLCEFKCEKAPKGARLDLSRKTDRQDVTRASGKKRVEDTRLGNVFEKEFGGEMYICLRTDPCPNDKTNKCKGKKPAATTTDAAASTTPAATTTAAATTTTTTTTTLRSDKCKTGITGKCKYPKKRGNKVCNDENNNAGCDWDGGDCCGPSFYGVCTKCQCRDCTYVWTKDKCTDKIKGLCLAKGYEGDGFCDPKNNNAGCGWDKGDCCGPKHKLAWCSKPPKGLKGKAAKLWKKSPKCKCLDCAYVPPITTTPAPKCLDEKLKNDGQCDDHNNNKGCAYDGGDCCGNNVGKKFCTKCECIDPNYKPEPTTTPTTTTAKPTTTTTRAACLFPLHKGDGACDDGNNRPSCGWDGGDCCGPSIKTDYCNTCACLDPNYVAPTSTATTTTTTKRPDCGLGAYKGDGNCDDENNRHTCDWDGGDCCGDIKDNYCKKCLCLNPNYVPPKKPDCGAPAYRGDKQCDDGNNIKTCGWDDGDCCGASGFDYCSVCKCADPNYVEPTTTTAACGSPEYKGDGNCDDENNQITCEWDGGDCCGTSVGKKYCKKCLCLDPNPPTTTTTPCGAPGYQGDGQCDDSNNRGSCGWDKGDCCGTSIGTAYCSVCKCLDPNHVAKATTTAACGSPAYRGDGNCDDGNNKASCQYDDGDCCGKNVGKAYCKKCECLDPNYKAPTTPAPKCGNASWKGDGNCDDLNNNKGCAYDGGDCCLSTVSNDEKAVNKQYCLECLCLDPNGDNTPKCTETCGDATYKNDGHCDDYNNNCGCEYDGGDCCKASVKGGKIDTSYCSICACLDPAHKK